MGTRHCGYYHEGSGRSDGRANGLVKRVGDRSVILHWDPVVASGLVGYHVYRAPSATEPFEPYSVTLPTNHFVDFEVQNGSTYRYRVRAVDTTGGEATTQATVRHHM